MQKEIEIKILDKKDFTSEILEELKIILDAWYYKSYMYQKLLDDLEKSHTFFKAFVAFLEDKTVWIIVLEDNFHESVDYNWYYHYHIQRVCVDSNLRSYWIGSKLIKAIKDYAFNKTYIEAIFWESNETWAMAFYINNWALFNRETIKNYNIRIFPEDNLKYFKEFLTNKKFRNYRYQTWDGIDFVFCKNKEIEKIFREKWYFGKEFLENN